jgi:WD40 repeat protein
MSSLVTSLSFDRSGNALVAGCSDSLVSIFDTIQGRRIRDMNCHKSLVTDVAWNRAECTPNIIATGSLDKSIILHDIR